MYKRNLHFCFRVQQAKEENLNAEKLKFIHSNTFDTFLEKICVTHSLTRTFPNVSTRRKLN